MFSASVQGGVFEDENANGCARESEPTRTTGSIRARMPLRDTPTRGKL